MNQLDQKSQTVEIITEKDKRARPSQYHKRQRSHQFSQGGGTKNSAKSCKNETPKRRKSSISPSQASKAIQACSNGGIVLEDDEGVVQTPRKNNARTELQQMAGPGKQSVAQTYPLQPFCPGSKSKASKVRGSFKESSKFTTNNVQAIQGRQSNNPQKKMTKADAVSIRECNLQPSDGNVNKYDRMLQSLEVAAFNQRKQEGQHQNGLTSTEATDPLQFENRTAALSISSGISKNTGADTAIAREQLAQLHAYQQYQQQLLHTRAIFDRNRPWNCDYCQPKSAQPHAIDSRVQAFSRKCVGQIVSRFMIKEEFYESRKVVELLNTNTRSVLVAQFKDYLIFDDIYEFLTSLYALPSSLDILTRHAVFYASLTSLEVLSQYREEQIRDRHLVLSGLKPCYIALEKQIQAIIASNMRNKLRLVLSNVKKIQLARGYRDDQNLALEPGSSDYSTPARVLTVKRPNESNQRTFKKLIQSSLVKEYNFSRSYSGLLYARDAPSMDIPARPNTNFSINFTNISFEQEVEMIRGSVFDESVCKQSSVVESRVTTQHDVAENIASNYMNAQLILDDLSSRPLTRQSIRQTNAAASPSRIHMYNLQNLEEQKMKVPFQAPEKPNDQKSGDDSSEFQPLSDEEIMIVNQGADVGVKRPRGSSVDEMASSAIDDQHLLATKLASTVMTENAMSVGTANSQVKFVPFAVPSDDQSLPSQESHSQHKLSPTVQTENQKQQQTLRKTTSVKPVTIPSTYTTQFQAKKQRRNNYLQDKLTAAAITASNSTSSVKQSVQASKYRDGNIAQQPYTGSKHLKARRVVAKETFVHDQYLSEEKRTVAPTSTGPSLINKFTISGKNSVNRNQVISTAVKASPGGCKSFGQQKAPSNRVLSLVQQSGPKALHFVTKKSSIVGSLGNFSDRPSNISKAASAVQPNEANIACEMDGHFTSQSNHRGHEGHEKIQVSKKLIAQMKEYDNNGNIVESPNKVQRLQQWTDRDNYVTEPGHIHRQSPQVTASVQLVKKILTPAKTMSHFAVKTLSNVQQQQQPNMQTISAYQQPLQRQAPTNQAKVIRTNATTGKRNEEKVKIQYANGGVSSCRNVMSGSAPNVFSPMNDKSSFLLHMSNDQKRPQQQPKNYLSIKEQILLEAIRRENNGQPIAIAPSSQRTMGGAEGVQLLRSQQLNEHAAMGQASTYVAGLITQSKSVVSQKVDLFSIAGKLKLLNQPNKKPNSSSAVNIPTSNTLSSRKRLPGQQNRKKSLNFATRQPSTDQRDDEITAGGAHIRTLANTTQSKKHKQPISPRFFLADQCAPKKTQGSEDIIVVEKSGEHSNMQEKEKVSISKNASKRKLVLANQQLEAYYTQRNQQIQHHQSQRLINVQQQSRNHASTNAMHGNDIKELAATYSGPGIEQKAKSKAQQTKKKVQKMTRVRNAHALSPSAQTENNSATLTHLVSPRIERKTRNVVMNTNSQRSGLPQMHQLAISVAKTMKQSASLQDRGPNYFSTHNQQIQRQQQHANIAPNQAKALTRQSQLTSNFEQVATHHAHFNNKAIAMSGNIPSSRNNGLQASSGAATTLPLTHQVAHALKELSLTPSTAKQKLSIVQSSTTKAGLQSYQQFPPATLTSAASQANMTLKQELKIHSRKTSAAFQLSHQASGPLLSAATAKSSMVKKAKKKLGIEKH